MRKVGRDILCIALLFILFFSISINTSALTKYEQMGTPVDNLSGLKEFNDIDTNSIFARVIYSEASSEGWNGKLAIYFIVKNRIKENLGQFGGSTLRGVLLNQPGGFDGLNTNLARKPDVASLDWENSCDAVTEGSTYYNPIGNCLWYNTNAVFKTRITKSGGNTYYDFSNGLGPQKIVEQVVLGNHTFFRIKGY